jgi:hypothetical protein
MSDGAEGLIDAEARIRERMEEREQQRSPRKPAGDPDRARRVESWRLARTELQRQLDATTHQVRRDQLVQAIAELNRRIAEGGAT